jgi:hypothetical protein
MTNCLILENLVFIQNICFLVVINRDNFILSEMKIVVTQSSGRGGESKHYYHTMNHHRKFNFKREQKDIETTIYI